MKFICPLIVVKEIKVARDFYEKLLGQKVKYDFGENVEFEGDFSIHLEEHYLKLLGEKEGKVIRNSKSFELYFESDDIDNVFKLLQDKNIKFIHEIKEQPWGQRVMRFYDPDLHIIEVGESMESVVRRYYRLGMSVKDIFIKTSMPEEFIKNTIMSIEK